MELADRRQSVLAELAGEQIPGGCSHACELETSLYLYLDEAGVRKDKIKSGTISINDEENPFNWVDLFGAGPGALISWTSSYSETGVLGDAEKATKEKGERAYNEAVKQLCRFVEYFQNAPRRSTPPRTAARADDAHSLGANGRTLIAYSSSCRNLARIAKSSSVVVSPTWSRPAAMSRSSRRMILPLRVLGRAR